MPYLGTCPLDKINSQTIRIWRQQLGRADLVVKAGLPAGFHFHDLRHTGNNLAASSGASTRELMHRMGHGSMRAALIYQHATSQRDREIADALGARIERESGGKWPGVQRASDTRSVRRSEIAVD